MSILAEDIYKNVQEYFQKNEDFHKRNQNPHKENFSLVKMINYKN